MMTESASSLLTSYSSRMKKYMVSRCDPSLKPGLSWAIWCYWAGFYTIASGGQRWLWAKHSVASEPFPTLNEALEVGTRRFGSMEVARMNYDDLTDSELLELLLEEIA